MTKTQKKAIEKAIKYELPKEQMEMIESEEYFAWFIAILPSFFYDANKNGIPISDSINYVKEHLLYAENRYCTQRNAWAFAQMPQFMLRLENERENLPHATYNYLINTVLNAGNCFQEKDLNNILNNIFVQKEFLKTLNIAEEAKREILNITAWRYETMIQYAAYCIWHEKKQPQIDNRFCEYYSEEDIQEIDILYKNENGITDLCEMAWRCNMQYEPLERLIEDFEKLSINWESIVYCVENNISFEESKECNFSIDRMKNLIRKKEENGINWLLIKTAI